MCFMCGVKQRTCTTTEELKYRNHLSMSEWLAGGRVLVELLNLGRPKRKLFGAGGWMLETKEWLSQRQEQYSINESSRRTSRTMRLSI